MSFPTFLPAGDSALLVTLGDRIDLATNRRAHALAARLAEVPLPGLAEAVPGYTTLLVHYDPLALSYDQVLEWVRACLPSRTGVPPACPGPGRHRVFAARTVDETSAAGTASLPEPRRIEVPVVYGGEHGPDLEFVARHNGLSPEEVVRRHTARDYPVYLVGFTPGFPYLGGLDETIAAPRLPSPRPRVLAGSVGIAGQQTGIYSVDSPGGWRLIGWTPLILFDPQQEPPSLLAPGDVVRFVKRET